MGKRHSAGRRRAAGIATALLSALSYSLPGPASASTAGGAAGQESVRSGSWGVVATQSTTSPPPTGALALTVTTTAAFYFEVVNDGTSSLSSITYNVAITTNKATLALTVCSVAWTLGACTGTTTNVGTWINGSPGVGQVASGTAVRSTTTPATAGSSIHLRGTPTSVSGGGTTFTVNMSVAATQLGAHQTVNS